MEATLTFEGLLEWDPDLFSTFSLPEELDRDTVINAIILKGTDRCVLWPDPEAMRGALAAWSALRMPAWSAMASALAKEYDPLENYDRREEGGWKDQRAGDIKQSGTNTSETEVAAYDSSDYEPRAKETQTPNLTTTDGTSLTRTFQQYRVHGNIGVTTSQQMLESEMELRSRWNLVEMIAEETVAEFTFGVY